MNIIAMCLDDTPYDSYRADYMPYLMSNPGGGWVTFSNSIGETAKCAPARAAYFAGITALRSGVRNNVDGDNTIDGGLDPTGFVPARLQAAGYYTGHVGKYLNGYPWTSQSGTPLYVPPGWNDWHSHRGAAFYGLRMNDNGVNAGPYPSDLHVTDLLTGRFLDMLTDMPEPFFAHFGHRAPHKPYVPPARHEDVGSFADLLPRRPNFAEADLAQTKPAWFRRSKQGHYGGQMDADDILEVDTDHLNALRCLLSVDEGLADIIDVLETRGILDDTAIFIFGDNSNCFGEHRHHTKGVPYEECQNILLKVRWPGSANRTDPALVNILDLPSTWCAIAGARMPLSQDGQSLVGLLNGTHPIDKWRRSLLIRNGQENPVQFGPGTFDGIRTNAPDPDGRWKYVEYLEGGEKEMYYLGGGTTARLPTADPYELTNLAGNLLYRDKQTDLARRLHTLQHGSDSGNLNLTGASVIASEDDPENGQ